MLGEGWIRVVRDRLTCEKQYVEIVVLQSRVHLWGWEYTAQWELEGRLLLPGRCKGSQWRQHLCRTVWFVFLFLSVVLKMEPSPLYP